VVVRNPDQDLTDLVWQAVNIGVEQIVGELTGGFAAWTAAGAATAHKGLGSRRQRPQPDAEAQCAVRVRAVDRQRPRR
jgi:hypothetical protein